MYGSPSYAVLQEHEKLSQYSYGLDDRGTGVYFMAKTRDSSPQRQYGL
jgi:hypothetical protein